MKKKNQTRNSNTNSSEYRGLDKKRNPKNRSEVADYDYLDKLSPKEKEFLNTFTEEYYNGTLPTRKQLETMSDEDYEKVLHKSPKSRSICWANNNKRNRDLYSGQKAAKRLFHIEDIKEEIKNEDCLNPEEMLMKYQHDEYIEKKLEEYKALKKKS